jgi:hypothetical protein
MIRDGLCTWWRGRRPQENDVLTIGLDAFCSQYAARNGTLVTGSGYHEPKIAVVAGNAAPHIDSPPISSPIRWQEANFSAAGQAELRRRTGSAGELPEAVKAKARQAFGLPPDAPVIGPG